MDQIPAIARVFGYLSLLTIGGGMAAYPEMRNLVVDVHHWLTEAQVVHIYSVGQAAPGPNMMMVAAMGERISGLAGAVVAAVAFFVPTGLLTFGVGRVWTRLENWPWRA
ncbi:MAG TPA: chromate transporter, partial [Candidatus Aquilonibacter sp.]